MIIVKDCIVSEELLENNFVCKLEACKGACCVEGDRGAPLDKSEVDIIQRNLSGIRKHMTPEFEEAIDKNGFYEQDDDGELVTTCQSSGECNFVKYQDGIALCAIEEAFNAGDSDFKKPISCHLYPIRTKRYKEFEAVNYHRWHICSEACSFGEELSVPVYIFVKEALIRKYGQAWFEELDAIANHLKDRTEC